MNYLNLWISVMTLVLFERYLFKPENLNEEVSDQDVV